MPKFKTATIILGLILLLALGAFFLPFDRLLAKIPYFKDFYNNTTVTFSTRNGKAEVFLDDKSYGETPVSIKDLEPKGYTFKLRRVSDTPGAYNDRYIQLDLERNTEAVVDLEIGPDNVNAGYVLYYTKSPSTANGKGYLSIKTEPADTSIYIDDEYTNRSPLNAAILNAKSYNLKLTKTGYEDLSFPVIVREGYNLNITSYLFPVPIVIDSENEQ